jgi:hypothetical protein
MGNCERNARKLPSSNPPSSIVVGSFPSSPICLEALAVVLVWTSAAGWTIQI